MAICAARSVTPCRRFAAIVLTISLTGPGLADLSAHVDFQALTMNTTSYGARAYGVVDQAVVSGRAGIDKRAAALRA